MTGLVEVQIRETCPDCENGVVARPEWVEFFADEDFQREWRASRVETAAEMEMRWFRDRGYTRTDRFGETLPPEEEPCPECDGAGKRMRWVDVRELSQMLWLREALEEQRL